MREVEAGPDEEPRFARVITWLHLKDPELQRVAERVAIAYVTSDRNFPDNILGRSMQEIGQLRDAGLVDVFEANELLENLTDFDAGTAVPHHIPEDTIYIDTLNATDLAIIDTGVDGSIRWLEGKFDTIYQVAQEGQEVNSELLRNYQQSVSIALTYLERTRRASPEILRKFGSEFSTRLNLIYARSQVERREIDGVIGAVQQLTSHGFMNSLSFDGGRVEAMYKSLQENYDDMRLRESIETPTGRKFHITTEMNARIQSIVEQEQMNLARQEIGVFGDIYRNERLAAQASIPEGPEKDRAVIERVEKRLQREIRRSVRTAYDAFVVSQRQAVIVARGRALEDPGHDVDNYLSDPGTLFASIYNQEDMLTAHFFLNNLHNVEFLDQIKLGIADDDLRGKGIDPKKVALEDRLELGKRLLRDLAAVPDFWSSGWRIKKALDQIQNIIGPERAGDFGLFLRLRGGKSEDRPAVWQKIAKFKPEDIVKLFREKIPGETADPKLIVAYESELERDAKLRIASERYRDLQIVFENNGLTLSPDDITKGITYYDKFKVIYGPLISAVREVGFAKDPPEQIDFAHLSRDQITLIDRVIGAEGRGRLVNIFGGMQDFGNLAVVSGENGTLVKSTRFEDIYTRTLSVDDALLNRLENVPEGSGLIALSKMWGSEIGGDALVRNAKDTKTAVEGFTGLLKFVREDDWEKKIENALIFAENASIYNGQSDKARAVRYTVGTALNLAKEDLIWDALAIAKSPFRTPISKMQRIYGQYGKVMSRDQLRTELDKYKTVLTGNPDVGEKFYIALERLLEVDLKGRAKEKGLAAFFAALLILALESVEIVKPRK